MKLSVSPPTPQSQQQPDVESTLQRWSKEIPRADRSSLARLVVEIARWSQLHPQSALGLSLLGDTYLRVGQPYAALKAYKQALTQQHDLVSAREGIGLAQTTTGQLGKALANFAKAHELAPHNPEILVHWGLAHFQTGNLKKAHERFSQARDLAPHNLQAHFNLALVDQKRGQFDKATRHLAAALAVDPTFAAAQGLLAVIYRQQNQAEKAIAAIEMAIQNEPDQVIHRLTLCELLLDTDQASQAADLLQQTIRQHPGEIGLYVLWAKAHIAQRHYADAQGVLQTALAMQPGHAEAQLEMAHLQLLQGMFDSGWNLHEARRRINASPVRRFDLPQWNGEDKLQGQILLVHAEQGLGDTIMFAHCLPDLIESGARVHLEVSSRLAPLFAHSFPDATLWVREPGDPHLEWLTHLQQAGAWQIPIGSLPLHFRRNLNDFEGRGAYIQAPLQRVTHWQLALTQHFGPARRPRIGLSWRGGLLQTGRLRRSLELHALLQSLKNVEADWVSLQYGDVSHEVAQAQSSTGVALAHWPDTLADQTEVAALTCALDAVLTVCTTQAHLTGALGAKGLVLVPYQPNWRYGAEGDTMPWYPSLRLLRQSSPEGWHSVLQQMPSRLQALLA